VLKTLGLGFKTKHLFGENMVFLILPKTLEKMTVDGNMSAFHSCHSEYLEWLSAISTDQPDEKLR
jgi:hypothetical protein